MVKLKEKIKCPSHEQNLEKQRRYIQVSIGIYRPNMSKAVIPWPYVHITFLSFTSQLSLSFYNCVF